MCCLTFRLTRRSGAGKTRSINQNDSCQVARAYPSSEARSGTGGRWAALCCFYNSRSLSQTKIRSATACQPGSSIMSCAISAKISGCVLYARAVASTSFGLIIVSRAPPNTSTGVFIFLGLGRLNTSISRKPRYDSSCSFWVYACACSSSNPSEKKASRTNWVVATNGNKLKVRLAFAKAAGCRLAILSVEAKIPAGGTEANNTAAGARLSSRYF